MSSLNKSVFLSCEHASNAIPDYLSAKFQNDSAQEILKTHRGYDIGALEVFFALQKILAPKFSIAGKFSRLAIDLNRNSNRNHRFSEFSEDEPLEIKQKLKEYFNEYRGNFLQSIKNELENPNAEILHLSIHSFTPELNGEIRNADLGILYDPSRKEESALAKKIQKNLILIAPDLRVRKNYPYQGKNDGHTTARRKIFPPEKYIGFEIEMNQAYLQKISPQKMAGILMESLF